ncbi:MAG: lipid-A-disaccharide synthase [Burkholderiales bacterium]|nr:lipid-A-disaccharide synthase [Burkholderiales bacterium]
MTSVARAATVAIVAGEASGDLLAASLVNAMRALDPGIRFSGVAGPRMQAAGVECLYPVEKLAVRGYVEVLRHFVEIVGIRRALRAHWLRERPYLFIGVDAPDFNFSLEADLRRSGIPTVHYVSPSIWAWRAQRMKKIRKAVTHMLALFPFEAPLYRRAGVPVTYVGHPLADLLPAQPDRLAAREQLRLPSEATIVTLLPGSRESELREHARLFVRTARLIAARRPDVLFLVPLVNRTTRMLFESALAIDGAPGLEVQLLFGHSHEALTAASVGLVASGTATLEAALLGCPMVITYRVPALTYRIMWPQRRLPYIGLPNVLAGEFIVPELLQDDATPENLAQALLNLIADPLIQRRVEARFAALRTGLRQGAANTAARAIMPLLARRT